MNGKGKDKGIRDKGQDDGRDGREPIAWRANKQDTVTTSSIEAELLALSQTAKEAIFISRIFKAIKQALDYQLRLIIEDTAKLITKLQYINIHRHLLRQEYAIRRVVF